MSRFKYLMGVFHMKKTFLLFIAFLSIFVLIGCKANSIDYTNDQLLVESPSTSLLVKDGVSYSNLCDQGYDFGVYESDLTEENGQDYMYKRMFFMTTQFRLQMSMFFKLITYYYADINDTFDDINDIAYIIYNKEIGIISFLPDETEVYTQTNTLTIKRSDYMTKYAEIYEVHINPDPFHLLHGINFRDLIVSYMNSSKDSLIFNNLGAVFFDIGINYSDREYLYYIDIKIDLESNRPSLVSGILLDMPIIRNDNSYQEIDGIPIDIIQDFSDLSNDNDQMVKDDIIITSNLYIYIDFYDMSEA